MSVTLRELGPGEVDVLDAVFAGLSETSRYRRFHGGVPRLSRGTRAALAAVDGRRHLAVAAFAGGEPIGIARLVALTGARPGRAELAVEVVDAWQGRGVGTRLVAAVLALGADAGFDEVVADVLSDNGPILRLLAALLPARTTRTHGPETRVTARLEGTPPMTPPATPDEARRAELLAAADRHRLARAAARPARKRRPGRPLVTHLRPRRVPAVGGDAA